MRLDNLWPRLVDRLNTMRVRRRGVTVKDRVVIIGK